MLAPTPFDINTSIQRSLVKAIALHGLGLNIYAGEDLPDLQETTEDSPLPKPPEPKPAVKRPAKVTALPGREPEVSGEG